MILEMIPIPYIAKVLNYGFFVLDLGSQTNYFKIKSIYENTFTIKTIGDMLELWNHIINILGHADIESEDIELQIILMAYVIVGGGFGSRDCRRIKNFVHDSVKQFYDSIDPKNIEVILINLGKTVKNKLIFN